MRHELVDEYRLVLHPVTVGHGRRLFRDDAGMRALELIDATTTTSGLVTLTYRRTNAVA